MVEVSGLRTSPSEATWSILVLKNRRNVVKGMRIQGCYEDKAESQVALMRIAKQEFQRVFQLWERHWVMSL
jgi:hypothetical protein